MLHKAWSSIEEVPYCFWRSSVKFQGHTALKIIKFDPNWVFPDCNSSLNSPMAMKCCTKLETAKERCPIVFQGHSSNFKVTRYKTSPILTQIGHFRTVGRSQLSNPSDLPCLPIITCRVHSAFMQLYVAGCVKLKDNYTCIYVCMCVLWCLSSPSGGEPTETSMAQVSASQKFLNWPSSPNRLLNLCISTKTKTNHSNTGPLWW